MQYLKNITTQQNFIVPTSGLADGSNLTLSIKSTVGHMEVLRANVTLTGNRYNYYKMKVTLPEGLSDGEYEYSIAQGDTKVGDGIVVIGTMSRPTKAGSATITFKQL